MDHLIKNKINHPRTCPKPPAPAVRNLVCGARGMGEVLLITGRAGQRAALACTPLWPAAFIR